MSDLQSGSGKGRLLAYGVFVFALLTLVGGAVYMLTLMQDMTNEAGPIQSWINRRGAGFYHEIDEQLIGNTKVNAMFMAYQANRSASSREALQLQIDLAESNLQNFSEGSPIGRVFAMRPGGGAVQQRLLKDTHTFLSYARKETKRPGATSLPEFMRLSELAEDSLRTLSDESRKEESVVRDTLVQRMLGLRTVFSAVTVAAIVCIALMTAMLVYIVAHELRRARSQRTRFTELEALFAAISHDLRSPLQTILTCTKLLEDSGLTGKVAQMPRLITEATNTLTRLSNDMVDVGRLHNGQFNLVPKEFRLDEWLQVIGQTYGSKAAAKGLNLLYNADQVPETITFDRERLNQMVGNLLDNAIKYTDTVNGMVKLDLSWKEGRGGAVMVIQVRDNGVPISADDRARIFNSFTRGRHRTTYRDGLGLGLTIVRGLAEVCDGNVMLEPDSGLGNVFTLRIPVKLASTKRLHLSSNAHSVLPQAPQVDFSDQIEPFDPLDGYEYEKILLVDDDANIRQTLMASLEMGGYDCQSAASGEEALSLLEQQDYDVLLTDIAMPGIDGIELANRVRKRDKTIKLIAITAHTSTLGIQKGADVFDQILCKPVGTEVVIETVERLLMPLRAARGLDGKSSQ